jgi:hypothetical protein
MAIRSEDLKTISQLGSALWSDPVYSYQTTLDTLAAISLLDLPPERALERAATALLGRARQSSSPISFELSNQLTSKLSQEKRFLLVALHFGRWSYDRLSRILDRSVEEVQEEAWNARLEFCSHILYPSAPSRQGIHCPEYNSSRPWTQKFLDDEITVVREKLFLQNHLMACRSCSEGLARCRKLYYQIEKEMNFALGRSNSDSDDAALQLKAQVTQMKAVIRQGVLHKHRSQLSFLESLKIFLGKQDVWWLSLAMTAFLGVQIFRQILR